MPFLQEQNTVPEMPKPDDEKPEAAEQLPGGSRSDDKIINFPGHGDTLSQQQFRLVSYRFPVHPHVCRMVTSQ